MTQWSDPKVCFDGKRPAEIPEGAEVEQLWMDDWLKGDCCGPSFGWGNATPENPITYRYKLPPVETEPFAVVFLPKDRVYDHYSEASGGGGWVQLALDTVEAIHGTVRFYDKHGNPVEPEKLDELTGESEG